MCSILWKTYYFKLNQEVIQNKTNQTHSHKQLLHNKSLFSGALFLEEKSFGNSDDGDKKNDMEPNPNRMLLKILLNIFIM